MSSTGRLNSSTGTVNGQGFNLTRAVSVRHYFGQHAIRPLLIDLGRLDSSWIRGFSELRPERPHQKYLFFGDFHTFKPMNDSP